MMKVESARGRQMTLAQLVVACRQGIRGQRQLVPRRTGKLPERVRLVCPVESRRARSVMVDAVLAALVIVEQTLAQFGHLGLRATSRGKALCARKSHPASSIVATGQPYRISPCSSASKLYFCRLGG